jgi:hypothetical protein
MNRTTSLLLAALLLALPACAKKEELCSSDLALCDAGCTSLVTDAANCGACGHACASGESCYAGGCLCPADRSHCGAACVDLASDPANCGACGAACPANQVCTSSAGVTGCASACAAGQTACGRACVDLAANVQSCGACGRACGSSERCSAGRCVADLYLACFNSDEVREATGALVAAGIPRPVAPGPVGLAWSGDLLAVASSKAGGAETIAAFRFDPPGVRRSTLLETSVAKPDFEYLAEHDALLYVSHASLGTLLVLTPGGTVLDEVRFVPAGSTNPMPQGIAFDDATGRAFVALNGRNDALPATSGNEVAVLDVSKALFCALGAASPPCVTEVARIDVQPLASPGANALPSRVAIAGGRAFVTLWNLDPFWNPPPGSTGRLAVIDTSSLDLDAAFAGTASGAIDLPGCLDPADVAFQGGELFVTCGAFDYSNYPSVAIVGGGIAPVDVSGPLAQPLPMIAPGSPDQAPGKLAFCGSTGYVGDRNSGRVIVFDPTSGSTTLGAGVELCPASNGYAYIADIACGP